MKHCSEQLKSTQVAADLATKRFLQYSRHLIGRAHSSKPTLHGCAPSAVYGGSHKAIDAWILLVLLESVQK